MTAPIAALLQPMKDRIAAATELGEWEVRGKDIVIYAPNGFGAYRAVAWVDHAEYTPVIAHAPTDQAKLIAAIEAVEELCADAAEQPATELMPVRALAGLVRAALTEALGGDTA